MRKRRLLASAMALALSMSLVPAPAMAAPQDDVQEGAGSVNPVQIYQELDRKTGTDVLFTNEPIPHNFATQGDVETLSYYAKLTMTEEMATYLYENRNNMLEARFEVIMSMETDVNLDFVTKEDGSVEFVFESTFLKPVETGVVAELEPMPRSGASVYTVTGGAEGVAEVSSRDGKTWFTYTINVPNANDLMEDELRFNAELILLLSEDGTEALSASDICGPGNNRDLYVGYDKEPLCVGMDLSDWMAPITLKDAKMKLTDTAVNGGKAATSESSAYTIKASGTIEGTFEYNGGMVEQKYVSDFADVYAAGNPEVDEDGYGYISLPFGEGKAHEGWTSNECVLKLYNKSGSVPGPGPSGPVAPPALNTEDHFGYVIGYPDGTVQPQGQITRAEVATIFFRMLTDQARTDYWSQTSSYTDVDADDWFNNAVCTLSKAGIINGYADGTFNPNGKITRAEFAAIASRFFEINASGETAFPDVKGHWAEKEINEAAAAGIINGYEDGTFRPQQFITRAEAMAMVNRTLERAPEQEYFLADMLTWVDNMDTTKWYYEDVQEATNSHEYEMKTAEDGSKYEVWTKMLDIRDWAALEKEWSDSNSSTNPGDVVK